MANKVIRSSGARWAPTQDIGVISTGPAPFFWNTAYQDSTLIDGNTLSPLIIRDDGPANTAHPFYPVACYGYAGALPSYSRPDGYEPTLYHGKPQTIVRPAKSCIVFMPTFNTLPFVEADFRTAIEAVLPTIKALGVHLYLSYQPTFGNFLLWGMPMGGYTAGAYADAMSQAVAPSSHPYGELLVLVMTSSPTGFAGTLTSSYSEVWNGGTTTLITMNCGATDSFAPTYPALCTSYYGFAAADYSDNLPALANDQAIAIEYISKLDRFEQRLHKYDDAGITHLYQDSGAPVGSVPAGYPGDATDVWLAATSGIPEYTVGDDISPLGSYSDMADTILASIQDFYS